MIVYIGEKQFYMKKQSGNKEIMWEITSKCNLKCKYCYENIKKDVEYRYCFKDYCEALVRLKEYGYNKINFSGGEIFLLDNIYEIIDVAISLEFKCNVISNFTTVNERFWKWILKARIEKISISLDSIDSSVNNYLRGFTSNVIKNIEKLVQIAEMNALNFKIEIQSTLTAINLKYIEDVFNWAKRCGIHSFYINPVSLSSSHAYKEVLALEKQEDSISALDKIEHIYNLKKELFENKYDCITQLLLQNYILTQEISVVDCMCIQEGNYIYINAEGNVFSCPRMRQYYGNIFQEIDIMEKRKVLCEFNLQCLCCLKKCKIERIQGED